jgi:hypothetical protein
MTLSIGQTVLFNDLTPARVVSTSNISGTYYNGPTNNGVGAYIITTATTLTVDSVLLAPGDRVLLSAQTAALQNGIYFVLEPVQNPLISTNVVLQRAFDQQNIEQLKAGQFVFIGAGATGAGDVFTLIEPLPQVIGVDSWTYNSNASAGSVTFSGPASTANALAVFSDTAGNLKAASTTTTLGQALSVTGAVTASGAITSTAGNITSGSSGDAGTFFSFPATAANGTLIFAAANAGGAFNTTVSNATSVGQNQVISIPDSGAATAKFLLDTGTGATATITKISTGATPVPLVDPGSCTITAAAGAANTATVTVQLKDGAGTNIGRIIPFKVYSSSASTGLTLASAASTGYSVASGGLSLANGTAVTTQINCVSSATGGCVLSLLDTGKQTSYLVLVVEGGVKISAQLSAGSYG